MAQTWIVPTLWSQHEPAQHAARSDLDAAAQALTIMLFCFDLLTDSFHSLIFEFKKLKLSERESLIFMDSEISFSKSKNIESLRLINNL